MPRRSRLIVIAISLGILLSIPLFGSRYIDFLFSMALIYAIWALGYNFLLGYTGLLSFGHGAYFGLGAYTVALLIARYSIDSLPIVFLSAIAVSTLFGAIIGYLCIRHVETFFALLTLAFSQLFYALTFKFYKWTGGSDGLHVDPPRIYGDLRLDPIYHPDLYYYFTLAIFLILFYIGWRIVNSPFGLALKSIRENPLKAEMMGIPVNRFKWYAFILSALYSGIAGALYAPLFSHVVPDLFHFSFSGEVLFATLLGGSQTYWGPVIGAFIFVIARSYITALTIYWPFVLGCLLAAVALLFPRGVAGAIEVIMSKYLGRKVR